MTAKKKDITLDSDKLHSMLFDVEWDLADKTQELINLLKALHKQKSKEDYKKAMSIVDKVENLLEKRMNVLSAQCLVYDEEEK